MIMKFFEKIVLKDVKRFQNLTTEQKERDVMAYKHRYISAWLAHQFIKAKWPKILAVLITIVNVACWCAIDIIPAAIVSVLTMPIPIFIMVIYIVISQRRTKKRESLAKVQEWLILKFQNLCLLNRKVISWSDWMYIKKEYPEEYHKLRTDYYYRKCYSTVFKLANMLQDPEISILYLCIDTGEQKIGHAVLQKNAYVYDTNSRRTYNTIDYFEIFDAEEFRDYPIYAYEFDLSKYTPGCENFDWDEFKAWCEEQGASIGAPSRNSK